MLRQIRFLTAALALCAASASAQVTINEVFVSHTGTDDREFIEVRGTPGASLNGYMFLILEGDSTSSFGALDVAIDLSAGFLDANGLYTAGASTVVPAVNQIVNGTGSPVNTNLFENGTNTFYFIQTTNPAGVIANLGQDLRFMGMGTVTTLTMDPAITILEKFALSDGGVGDVTFDGATVYMDGTFLPAGLVKCGDAPLLWNPLVLDFDFIPNPGTYIDVSPSVANPNCGVAPGPGAPFCFGDGTGLACPCANDSVPGNNEGCLHSLGTGGKLTGTGSASISADTIVLNGTLMPNSSALYFQGTILAGTPAGNGTSFGDGKRCAGGGTIRLGTKTNVAGASAYPVGADLSVSVRGMVTAPGSRTYQCWFRNAATFCTASTFNLTNGWETIWGV